MGTHQEPNQGKKGDLILDTTMVSNEICYSEWTESRPEHTKKGQVDRLSYHESPILSFVISFIHHTLRSSIPHSEDSY